MGKTRWLYLTEFLFEGTPSQITLTDLPIKSCLVMRMVESHALERDGGRQQAVGRSETLKEEDAEKSGEGAFYLRPQRFSRRLLH